MAEINSYQITLTDDSNGDVDVSLEVLSGQDFAEVLQQVETDPEGLSGSQRALLMAWNGVQNGLESEANDVTE